MFFLGSKKEYFILQNFLLPNNNFFSNSESGFSTE